MSMRKAMKEKAKEAIQKHPHRKMEIMDILSMAYDEIENDGSETLECERAIDAIQEIIDTPVPDMNFSIASRDGQKKLEDLRNYNKAKGIVQ